MKELTPHKLAIDVNRLMKEVIGKFVGRADTGETRAAIGKEVSEILLRNAGEGYKEGVQIGIDSPEPGGYRVVPKNLFTGLLMCGVPLAVIEATRVCEESCTIGDVRYEFKDDRFLVTFPKSSITIADKESKK